MVELTFDAISALFVIWTELSLLLCRKRLFPKEVVKTGAMATQRVIWGHELVIHKGVHEEPFLNAFLPLRSFSLEVAVGVIGYDDSIGLICQLHNKAVIIANHSLTTDTARWSEDHYFPFFELHQYVLIFYGGIRSGLLFAPSRNKHSNGIMTSVKEEIHCELDASA